MKEFWLEKSGCSGCAACMNICPVGAITMVSDGCGFVYPSIDESCIDCGKCEDICMKRLELPQVDSEPPTYAVWSKDAELRFESTSGGAFTELATPVIENGGAVVAAVYGNKCSIVHAVANNGSELIRMRQSKYAQSSINDAFKKVKALLEQGSEVLFCGCPCQVAGLKAYLGKEWDSLLCVDFICRGVNSPKALSAWLEEIEIAQGSPANRVWFKYKTNGWKLSPRCTRIDFENGEYAVFDQQDNAFMVGYLEANLYMRPSCSECDFKGARRCSDVTLGDFWGLSSDLDDDKGASLLLVNTPKGAKAFERVRRRLEVHERDYCDILAGNVCFESSVKLNPKSTQFFIDLDAMPFSEALRKSYKKKLSTRIIRKVLSHFR